MAGKAGETVLAIAPANLQGSGTIDPFTAHFLSEKSALAAFARPIEAHA
jgi:hypothetical protein